ncbi:hypothetical protein CH252_19230 [Rhodococcus sp. 06-1477-1B]|nr:hypothetical protein CH252_19230 [Rhodococcus sp. 06-1477-1B]
MTGPFVPVGIDTDNLLPAPVEARLKAEREATALSMAAAGPSRGIVPGRLLKWRRKLGELRSQVSDARVLVVSDSTGAGVGATVPVRDSYSAVLARQVNSSGLPASLGLIIPPSQISNDVNRDPRWTLGSGWTLEAKGFGNASVFGSAAGAGDLLLTVPTEVGPVDRYDVYYIGNGTSPSFSVNMPGRSSAAVVAPGSLNGIGKITVTSAEITGPVVTVTPAAAGGTRIVGIEAYSSTRKRLLFANAGVPSTSSVGWINGGAYGALPSIQAYAPDLTVISLGLNDSPVGGTSRAAFKANMTSIINAARVSGDVILMTFAPRSVDATAANITMILEVYRELSDELGIQLVDVYSRWVSYAVSQPLGYWSDVLHPSTRGYADIAQALLPMVVDASGARPQQADASGMGLIATFDPLLATTSANTGSTDRLNYYRVPAGGQISKIGLEVLASAGNVVVAAYRNVGVGRDSTPGMLLGSSGVVACPAVGYAEVALTNGVELLPGDWLAIGQTDAGASFRGFYNNAIVSNFYKGRAAYQSSAIPAPAVPTPVFGLNRVILLVGVA